MRKVLILPLVVALALVVAACGGGDDDGDGDGGAGPTAADGDECPDLTGEGESFTITLSSTQYVPGCFTASASQGIQVVNEDSVTHSFTMVGTEIDVEIGGGETFEGEPIEGAVEPGTYDLQCRFHPSMTGEVTVVA